MPYQAVLIPLITTLQVLKLYGTLRGPRARPHHLRAAHHDAHLPQLLRGHPERAAWTRRRWTAPASGASTGGSSCRSRRPAFVVVGIWQFTNIWNEFLFALTITNSPDTQPVTVSLQNLAGSFAAQYNVQLAGALLAALPTLVVYVLLGRYFVRGLLAGSLKG